jgi:pimeloyl-ACP methyl ester carboxylesterase
VSSAFTPQHRGGSGSPLVCLHGFTDTWRTWELVLPALEREHDDLDAEQIECPVRIVWGTADQILPWPSSAARFRDQWLPSAEYIELDGIGHCPQLDVPLEAAQLILGFASS